MQVGVNNTFFEMRINQETVIKNLQKLKRTCVLLRNNLTDSLSAICCHHPSARIKLHDMMSFYFRQKRKGKMIINQDQMWIMDEARIIWSPRCEITVPVLFSTAAVAVAEQKKISDDRMVFSSHLTAVRCVEAKNQVLSTSFACSDDKEKTREKKVANKTDFGR